MNGANGMKWIKFEVMEFNPHIELPAPYDGTPFIASIWGGEWIGLAIYARHYSVINNSPGKYVFFYITRNPEEEGWGVRNGEDPFPITHWMPLPDPPQD